MFKKIKKYWEKLFNNVETEEIVDIPIKDVGCLCEQNINGAMIMGRCAKHHTDWI